MHHRFSLLVPWLAWLRLLTACLAVLQHWSLFKKLWPFGGMYTTMAALTTDKEGAALTYAVIFAAGSLGKLPLCWRLGCILPRARAMISSWTGGVSGTGTITCERTTLARLPRVIAAS